MTANDRPLGATVSNFNRPAMPGPSAMSGRFVQLERLNADVHAADLFAANQDGDQVWDYLGYGPFARVQEYQDWQVQAAQSGDPCFYAIRDLSFDRVLGIAAYLRIDPANGVIEIGHIQMSPPLQRTAAATEALTLMIRWTFDAGYRRVEWKCNALNAPSRRAAIRLGFSFEGQFRQHMISKGRNRDTAWYSILDREWPVLRMAYDTWLAPANFDADGQQRESLNSLTDAALPGRGDGVIAG